jgi:class 3 adenylate cyclase
MQGQSGTTRSVWMESAGLPERERILFRIGVNLGDVALVDGDVYGDGVNVASGAEVHGGTRPVVHRPRQLRPPDPRGQS